jgi:hypothetical protein
VIEKETKRQRNSSPIFYIPDGELERCSVIEKDEDLCNTPKTHVKLALPTPHDTFTEKLCCEK